MGPLSTTSDEEESIDSERYNVPSSRPCTTTSSEHTYNNNNLSGPMSMPRGQSTPRSVVSDLDQISAQWLNRDKDSNAMRDRFLDQNQHYVNGYLALRETWRQAQKPLGELTWQPRAQHNLTYVNSESRPNAIVNKCYDLGIGFHMPTLVGGKPLEAHQIPLCDMKVNKNYM